MTTIVTGLTETMIAGVTATGIIGEAVQVQNRPMQNIAERLGGSNEMYRRMLDGYAERHRGAMPAQVVSFNAEQQTIVAQPLIREKVIDRATGSVQWVQLPQLPDVPVQFPQAGNFVLTMPIKPGDEVLLIFNDMCIDSWWTSGGVQNWNVRRRHDLSDAVAIPGINSKPNAIQNTSRDSAELRSKDGTVKVSIKQIDMVINDVHYTDNILTINASGVNMTLQEQNIVVADVPVIERSISQSVGTASITLNSGYQAVDGVPVSASRIDLNGKLYINGSPYLGHKHADPVSGTTGPVIP